MIFHLLFNEGMFMFPGRTRMIIMVPVVEVVLVARITSFWRVLHSQIAHVWMTDGSQVSSLGVIWYREKWRSFQLISGGGVTHLQKKIGAVIERPCHLYKYLSGVMRTFFVLHGFRGMSLGHGYGCL